MNQYPNTGGAMQARLPGNQPGSVGGMQMAASPSPNLVPNLEGLAAHTADNLLRCHSIVDRMEAVVFGPEPPNVANGAGQPVGTVGLTNRMAEGVSITSALGDRLQRLAERLGG